ncbi:HAD-IIIA family hydrolase [Deltaproteobacteria bacterium TL4]
MKQKAVFLDRDGVLNESAVINGKAYAPRSLAEFYINPQAIEFIPLLKQAGFLLIVVSNQPDVGNGKTKQEIVESMNQQLQRTLSLDSIKMCYHSQRDECFCRKPKAGMLLEAASELDIDFQQSYMIGDRWSDVVAGNITGCYTLWLNLGYTEPITERPGMEVSSLKEAVEHILWRERQLKLLQCTINKSEGEREHEI